MAYLLIRVGHFYFYTMLNPQDAAAWFMLELLLASVLYFIVRKLLRDKIVVETPWWIFIVLFPPLNAIVLTAILSIVVGGIISDWLSSINTKDWCRKFFFL